MRASAPPDNSGVVGGADLMGWERRRNGTYYYYARREGGRVVKTYVGTGPSAAVAADVVEAAALTLESRRLLFREAKAGIAAVVAELGELGRSADAAARAALLSAGYRRHHRGEWRKRLDPSPGEAMPASPPRPPPRR